jgi:nitrite reductase (NO-forming)
VGSVRPRTTVRLYQTAARLWLTAAGLSLFLPESARRGIWLPLHLTLAGAISVAISGAMQNFVSALTATPAPPAWAVGVQFAFVNIGAGLVAAGYPSGHPAVVAVGGSCFLAGMVFLGAFVARAQSKSLNDRHRLPLGMYVSALIAIVIGGILGTLIGSGTVHDAGLYLSLRRAHLTINVLGWVSLAICGTLVTFLPTALRIRIPPWRGTASCALLVAGVAAVAGGLATSVEPLAGAGGLMYAAGTLGIAAMVGRALRTPRRSPVPVSAMHLMLGVGWFVVGALLLAIALLRGSEALDAFGRSYLVIFVGGFAVQTLLGAWLYLLPTTTPAHPDDRKKMLAAIEFGSRFQLVALNGGLVLLGLRAAGWVPGWLGRGGAGLALAGGGLALLKAWGFAALAQVPLLSSRQHEHQEPAPRTGR